MNYQRCSGFWADDIPRELAKAYKNSDLRRGSKDMNCHTAISVLSVSLAVGAFLFGCTPESNAPSSQDLDKALQNLAAGLPRKIDVATTLVEVKSDGQGGIVYVDAVDTSMIEMPAQDKLKHLLCDIRSDSPPPGNVSPFSGLTYIYRDLQGHQLAQMHFNRGECPGQAM